MATRIIHPVWTPHDSKILMAVLPTTPLLPSGIINLPHLLNSMNFLSYSLYSQQVHPCRATTEQRVYTPIQLYHALLTQLPDSLVRYPFGEITREEPPALWEDKPQDIKVSDHDRKWFDAVNMEGMRLAVMAMLGTSGGGLEDEMGVGSNTTLADTTFDPIVFENLCKGAYPDLCTPPAASCLNTDHAPTYPVCVVQNECWWGHEPHGTGCASEGENGSEQSYEPIEIGTGFTSPEYEPMDTTTPDYEPMDTTTPDYEPMDTTTRFEKEMFVSQPQEPSLAQCAEGFLKRLSDEILLGRLETESGLANSNHEPVDIELSSETSPFVSQPQELSLADFEVLFSKTLEDELLECLKEDEEETEPMDIEPTFENSMLVYPSSAHYKTSIVATPREHTPFPLKSQDGQREEDPELIVVDIEPSSSNTTFVHQPAVYSYNLQSFFANREGVTLFASQPQDGQRGEEPEPIHPVPNFGYPLERQNREINDDYNSSTYSGSDYGSDTESFLNTTLLTYPDPSVADPLFEYLIEELEMVLFELNHEEETCCCYCSL